MGEKKVKPPKLPAGAPKELKDFLACKVMEVDLDPANAGWIPRPELVPEGLAPTVTPTATGPNAVSVSVGWGFVAITLPVTLANGQLQVDASNMPGKQSVDDWVKSFNDSLKANNRELSGLELRNGKIHLTKRVIPPRAEETAATPAVVPPAPAVTTPPANDAKPQQDSTDDSKLKPGCLIGIILALVLLLGASLVYMLRDDSDSSDTSASSSSASTSSVAPLDEGLLCARLEILQAVLDEFGVDDPCEIDPEDFWDACEEAFMPCFTGLQPLIAVSPFVGITHDGSVPDAVTGQTGPSQVTHLARNLMRLLDEFATIEVTSQCGNNMINGVAMLALDEVTPVQHPLFNFGPCRASVYYNNSLFRQLIASYDFTVDASTPLALEPSIDGITVPRENTLHAAGTTLGLLAGRPFDPACTWFTADSSLLTLAECLADRFVFNAGRDDARVAAFGAAFVNPLGMWAPTPEQMTPFGPSRLFGPGTLFPCGPGHFGYTACAPNEATVETSSFVAGTVAMSSRLDQLPEGTLIEVGYEEYWARLLRAQNSWTFTSSEGDDSQTRAILRGNAVTFMIPYDEPTATDLTYSVKVGDSTGEVAQPAQPILGIVTSTQGPETPVDFFQKLSASFASGDLTFALDRLHPLVLEAFPGDACANELALRVTPDQIMVDSVGETGPWTWELPDGRSVEVPDATTVWIRLPGATEPVDAHIVNIDREYHWFTTCDQR